MIQKLELTALEIASKQATIEKAEELLTRIRICTGSKVIAGPRNYDKIPSCFYDAMKIFESVKDELPYNEAIAFALLKTSNDKMATYEIALQSHNVEKLYPYPYDNVIRPEWFWFDSVRQALRDIEDNIDEKKISYFNKARLIIGLSSTRSPGIMTDVDIGMLILKFSHKTCESNREAIKETLRDIKQVSDADITEALSDCVMD